ncbi:MAG TPA: type II secretion system F family protein [Abditibacterium sp.]|jgi:type II secretory pathway component PulF
MAQWVYEARDGAGRVVSGTHDAADRRTALEFLRSQGLFLTRLEAGRNGATVAPVAPVSAAVSAAVAAPNAPREVARPEPLRPNPAPLSASPLDPPYLDNAGVTRRPPVGVPPAAAVAAAPIGPGRGHSASAGEPIPRQPFLRASTKDLSLYFRQMGAMIHAGTSLGAALHSMVESAPTASLRNASAQMERRILGGEPLAETMKAFPGLFTPLQIGMAGAGERGGLLDAMFERLARYAERDYDLQQTIKSETWYPKLLVFCSILIPGLVPLIVYMIKGGPFPTRELMANIGVPLLLVGAVVGAFKLMNLMAPMALSTSGIKMGLDTAKLKIPVASKVVRAFATAKFCRALGALYSAGVGPGESVRLAAGACGNEAIAKSAVEIIPRLEHGESLTDCLASTKQFPVTVLQVMRVGEQSGALDEQLDKSADFLESDAEVAVKQAIKVLGILVFLAIACVIGSKVIQFWSGYFDQAFDMGENMATGG